MSPLAPHRSPSPSASAWRPAVRALAAAALAGVLLAVTAVSAGAAGPVSGVSGGDLAAAKAKADAKKAKITYPRAGRKAFKVATGRSAVAGSRGPLLRYRVSVEKDIKGVTANQFAARVVQTLSDERSWVGTGQVRLQRVPNSAEYDFTIYLATPQTRDSLCGDATRANPDRYTSCRNGDRVVLNVARWAKGVPKYGASLETYRTYMINHETGHRLGHHHQKCTGSGRKAPVMQQQTLGLHGCKANAWPRVNGSLYEGPAGAYNDPIPSA
ncbi:DUF3152 domain-containing protein [Kineosporia rhizophila]|uniref:DUF3152 domain-containing protein n=1 Tax=Kineosporia rhizophila TaxID=84633 RepID=UPI001E614CD4|nr:DUF3152 domain-containing protein [Kineosporia rhizophila]